MWVRGKYEYIIIDNVTGLQIINITDNNEYKISHSNNVYENCDNFVEDIYCERYRRTHTKIII